jgi:hypothetical protein
MACGKPPNPARMTHASPLRHPDGHLAVLREAERVAQNSPPGQAVDDAINWATRVLEQARNAGTIDRVILERLEATLEHVKGFAQARMKDNVYSRADPRAPHETPTGTRFVKEHFHEQSAQRNAPTVIRALSDRNHWRSKEYRDVIFRLVEGNARIPDHYREQLRHDVAEVLRVCPNAAGIVKAMTLRGQGTGLASRAKLGSNANAAIGSAYELMGTAAISRQSSKAINGGPTLFIDPATDKLSFGAKSIINREANRLGVIDLPPRRTVESDLRIGRKGLLSYQEIGIDFKHSKDGGPRYASDDLRSQVQGIVRAISHGDMDEYHFVTNASFGGSFREVVAEANGAFGQPMIGLHEHVTSLPPSIL